MARLTSFGALLVSAAMVMGSAPVGAQSAAGPTLQKIRDTGTIVIGHRLDGLPFAYLDANKRPIGYGIDVCHEIINLLKRELKLAQLKVEYVPVTAANRIEIVRSGRADIECGLTVNNPERRKEAGYAMPYYFAGPRILTKVDSGINSFFDLRGKRIVSAKGANAVPILRRQIETGLLPGAQLTEVANNNEAFAKLEKGEVDAYVTTDNLLYAYRANAADPKKYAVVGDYLILEAVAIMLRKDDVEFKKMVDRLLASLMLDGVVARLYNKWFLSPIPPKGVTLGIPMSSLLRDQLRWPTDRTGDEFGSEAGR
jgi:glutamate/aspartate transport system substrate-binding protein